MAEYPLLMFPEPAPAEREGRPSPRGKARFPDAERQAERLTPQFLRLQEALDRQRLLLQNNSLGLQPEQVLVLETIGPIQNFANAIKKVQGLEWLGDFELEDISPEFGFEDEKDPQKQLKGQLFLVMTDQQALQELRNLFSKWQQNHQIDFPSGLAPLKHAFAQLYTIRPWDAQDRIRDTGILEDWQMRFQQEQKVVPFEAELWFRRDPSRRRQALLYLDDIIGVLGGEIVQQCVIPEIAYHGILGKIPIDQATGIMARQDVKLLQCEDVMYLRPVGQCAIPISEGVLETDISADAAHSDMPQGEPLVALLDGLPLTGHHTLKGRLIVDDPDGYESTYQARERAHGTAMASLICNGDLNAGGSPSGRPLYIRPILQPRRDFDGNLIEEAIPENILPVDLVHRSVRRMFESEGGEPPAAPSVRIINLSVGDRSRPLDRGMSSWARLLDWLSWKYSVLFVVSAGNHTRDIVMDIPRANLRNLVPAAREQIVIKALALDTRHRRLLAPAESFNCLTVGATHTDFSISGANPNLIDPFARQGIPSTYSAQGPGYRRTIKPDILLPGGRQFLSEKLGNTHPNAIFQVREYSGPPGQRVATPGPLGELDRTIHTRGTSNSAALASRWANSLFEVINRLRTLPEVNLPSEYDVVLLKTLLVHGADSVDMSAVYESILKTPQNSRTFTDYIGRFFGYGDADVAKIMVCTEQRVTVLGVGKLDDGDGQIFAFPLPPSLSAITDKRRLAITLSWLTPVNCASQKYRIAHLWFNPKNILTPERVGSDWHAVQRGTTQHEVLEGEKAVVFQDGDKISIKVNCRADAGDIPEPIRYCLAVTLEVAEGINIPIYQEVRERLRIRIPLRGSSGS